MQPRETPFLKQRSCPSPSECAGYQFFYLVPHCVTQRVNRIGYALRTAQDNGVSMDALRGSDELPFGVRIASAADDGLRPLGLLRQSLRQHGAMGRAGFRHGFDVRMPP